MSDERSAKERPWIFVGVVQHGSMPPWIPERDFSRAMFAAQDRALAKWPREALRTYGLERVHIAMEFGTASRSPRVRQLSEDAVQVQWFGSLPELVLAAGMTETSSWFAPPVDAAMLAVFNGRPQQA